MPTQTSENNKRIAKKNRFFFTFKRSLEWWNRNIRAESY